MLKIFKSQILLVFFGITFGISQLFAEEVHLIKDPMHAVTARLELIDSAKELIQIDYYIFSEDLAGYATMAKLLEAARRGVKIEMILDGYPPAPAESLTDSALAYLLKVARDENLKFELKKYNVPSNLPWKFLSSRAIRSHDKLLIIDRNAVMTGDRNIGNPYFQIPGKRFHKVFGATTTNVEHFAGLEVVVRNEPGESSKSIRKVVRYSTAKFQQSFVTPVTAVGKPQEIDEIARRVRLASTLVRRYFNKYPHKLAEWRQDPTYVRDSEFIHDPVDRLKQKLSSETASTTARELYAMIRQAKPGDTVQFFTPFFIMTPEASETFRRALNRDVKLQIYTLPTDFQYEGGGQDLPGKLTPFEIRKVMELGAEVFVYNDPNNVAMHDKAIVVKPGQSTKIEGVRPYLTSVTTYNMDPRSQNLNLEQGFVFDSQELQKKFEKMMEKEPYVAVSYDEVQDVEDPDEIFKRQLKKSGWGCLINCIIRDFIHRTTGYGKSGSKGRCGDLFTLFLARNTRELL